MQIVEKRRRRRYTPAFKAAAVAACGKPGASVAAVALELQLNTNMLRVWIKRSRSGDSKSVDPGRAMDVAGLPMAFLPVPLADRTGSISMSTTLPSPPSPERSIRVQIHKGASRITIEWPTSAASTCAAWLRELIA